MLSNHLGLSSRTRLRREFILRGPIEAHGTTARFEADFLEIIATKSDEEALEAWSEFIRVDE